MSKILEQLYLVQICPREQYHYDDDENFQKYKDACEKFREKLAPSLSEEFGHIMDVQFDMLFHEYSQVFSGGFKLGAKMMLEVLGEEPNIESDEECKGL